MTKSNRGYTPNFTKKDHTRTNKGSAHDRHEREANVTGGRSRRGVHELVGEDGVVGQAGRNDACTSGGANVSSGGRVPPPDLLETDWLIPSDEDVEMEIEHETCTFGGGGGGQLLSFVKKECGGDDTVGEGSHRWKEGSVDTGNPPNVVEMVVEKPAPFSSGQVSRIGESVSSVDGRKKGTHVGIRVTEFWVPVMLSDVQNEQYCASLLSNSLSLCSNYWRDPTFSVYDLLKTARKSCDHPYLVDKSLRSLVDRIEPDFAAEIQMSGKLQVLMKILPEIKRHGLRVVILFQAGEGEMTIGDILDDLVQKFFPYSYSRIGAKLSRQRKQALLELFNKKKKSVCLLETRALASGMKLSSVDSIIIFNSDWDPTKDLNALGKITVEPPLEELRIFRLYSPYTVEEKALILAKEGLAGNKFTTKRKTWHSSLAWGSFYQFARLESSSNYVDRAFAEDVVQDLLALLPCSSVEKGFADRCSTRKIKAVQLTDGAYQGKGIHLVGESESSLSSDLDLPDEPHIFWRKLLQGRNSSWKYLPNSWQRSKRKVESIIKVEDEWPSNDAKDKTSASISSASGNRRFGKQSTEMPTIQPGIEAVESSPHLAPNVLSESFENENGGVPVTARPGAADHDVENTNHSEAPQETDLLLQEAREDAVKVQQELDAIIESNCEKELASTRMKHDLVRADAASVMALMKLEIESCHQLPLKQKLLDEAIQKQRAFFQKQLDKSHPADMQEMVESASLITTEALMRIIEQRTNSEPVQPPIVEPQTATAPAPSVLPAGSSSAEMTIVPIELDQCLVHPHTERRRPSIPDKGVSGNSRSRSRARAPAPPLKRSLPRSAPAPNLWA